MNLFKNATFAKKRAKHIIARAEETIELKELRESLENELDALGVDYALQLRQQYSGTKKRLKTLVTGMLHISCSLDEARAIIGKYQPCHSVNISSMPEFNHAISFCPVISIDSI